jgi:hypothetical protein
MISKAEALETAELALAEQAPAKRNVEEGEIATPMSKLPPKRRPRKKRRVLSVANYMALDRAMMPLDAKSSMAKSMS